MAESKACNQSIFGKEHTPANVQSRLVHTVVSRAWRQQQSGNRARVATYLGKFAVLRLISSTPTHKTTPVFLAFTPHTHSFVGDTLFRGAPVSTLHDKHLFRFMSIFHRQRAIAMSKLRQHLHVVQLISFAALVLPAVPMAQTIASPQTCPFDDGHSSLEVEGLILTRYALGITGAPLVANSGIAAASATTVEDSINSQAYDLRLTGNPSMTPVDATIISRKLAGFSGVALTNGLELGTGSRNTPAAVQSFLLSGCPGTAWVQGGNAFGAPGVIGTSDAQPLTVKSGGTAASLLIMRGDGLRLIQTINAGANFQSVNVINGLAENSVTNGGTGATIAGGGYAVLNAGNGAVNRPNTVTSSLGTVGGGAGNSATYSATVSGGVLNLANGGSSVVGGGVGNAAFGDESAVGGGSNNNASASWSTVGGGNGNVASGQAATVGGGFSNIASANYSSIPGGTLNIAAGLSSFAGGTRAKALSNGCFVWGDYNGLTDFTCSSPNQFLVRATGGVGINTQDPAGAQLHVVGPGETAGVDRYEALFSSASSTQVAIRSTSAGGRVWTLQSSNGAASGSLAGSFQIVDRTAAKARVLIDAAGNTYNNSGAWGVISDARLKKNIRDLDAPLETFLKLRGHRFEYKNPDAAMATPGERLGFIAQEVQTAMPQWVHRGQDGMLSIVSTGFDALVVEAMRALREEKDREIAQVRTQNDALIVALASRVTQLEASNAAASQLREELTALKRIVEALSANAAPERRVAQVIKSKDR
jgi:hypothetical protein